MSLRSGLGVRASSRVRCVGVALLAGLVLASCSRELSPISPNSRVGDHPAQQVVLALGEPCELSPGGTPKGHPPAKVGHTLPAGRYTPSFEDERGVFFASPNGVLVSEPAFRGTRARPGGIYLPSATPEVAEEYLGDAERVTERTRLPESCRYSIENAAAAPAAG